MELNPPPTDIILNHPHSTLGRLRLDWSPEPGAHLEIEGQSYIVLERKHRYLLKSGRYQLHQITLYVQKFQASSEKRLVDGHWIIGDMTCLYNARSELLRCAVNPDGPCDRCLHYQPLKQP
ncbi:MAG: DUF6464 family protein [Oculatellaceae cyanobacterium bins.114]|nr:DUF6464 family protein [Oculatellaceae cyanobacterium bins.114]